MMNLEAGVPDHLSYLEILDALHRHLLPRCYLEIGVRTGGSARLALPGTKAILIDPEPIIRHSLPEYHYLERVTSDEFFATRVESVGLSPGDVDLAYIDGLHLFETALRDLFNVEQYCNRESVIVLDDCVPPDATVAGRTRTTSAWAGDVWRVLSVLDELGDVRVTTVAVEPAGMAIVTGVNPDRNLSDTQIDALIKKYRKQPFSDPERVRLGPAAACAPTWPNIEQLLPIGRRNDDVQHLVAQRDARREGWRHTSATLGRQLYQRLPGSVRESVAPWMRRLSGQQASG